MKENNSNTTMTEADFDARCRSMLEASTAVAPEPRADLFADSAPKGADLRGAKWGGVALVLVGALAWVTLSSRDGEAILPGQGAEREAVIEAQGTELENVAMESASVEAVQEAATTAEQDVSEVGSALTSTPIPSKTSKADPSGDVPSEPQAQATEATGQPSAVEQASTASVEAGSSSIPAEPVISEEPVPAVGASASNPVDALPVETAAPAAEELPAAEDVPAETPANGPKLTLPLTLPSGGGQR